MIQSVHGATHGLYAAQFTGASKQNETAHEKHEFTTPGGQRWQAHIAGFGPGNITSIVRSDILENPADKEGTGYSTTLPMANGGPLIQAVKSIA